MRIKSRISGPYGPMHIPKKYPTWRKAQSRHRFDNLRKSEGESVEWYNPPEKSAFVSFFLKTTLHGLKYVGEKNLHICERVMWITAFIAAVITSSIVISGMWNDYQNTPIITVFSPTEMPISNIPFPAVTICSSNVMKKSKFEEARGTLVDYIRNNMSYQDERVHNKVVRIIDMYNLCHSTKSFSQKLFEPNRTYALRQIDRGEVDMDPAFNATERLPGFFGMFDVVGTIHNVSQSCHEMVILCIWMDTAENCSTLFQQVLTDYGYCCTMNMLPVEKLRNFVGKPTGKMQSPNDWDGVNAESLLLDPGNQKSERDPIRRQLHAGRTAGFSVMLDPDLLNYQCSNTESEGFVVGLNLPIDYPRMIDNGIAVKPSSEVFVGLRPDITVAHDTIRNTNLEKRHCYFEGERQLHYYKKYTTSNCLDECITNKTMEMCNCTRYYMPRTSARQNVCLPPDVNCTEIVKEDFVKAGTSDECKCYPPCTEIEYRKEVSSLDILLSRRFSRVLEK